MKFGSARARIVESLRALTLRTLLLLLGAVAASIVFVIIARELRSPGLDQLDKRIELGIHRANSIPADLLAATASFIGSNLVLIPLVIGLVVLCVVRGHRFAAVVLAFDTIAVMSLDQYLKTVFARPRPELFSKIPLPTDYSFPSGHSMSAVGVWGVIAAVLILLYPAWRRSVTVGACIMIPVIGLSRIYFGVHWPFDVLGGFLGGTPPLLVSVHLIHRRKRIDQHVADFVAAETS